MKKNNIIKIASGAVIGLINGFFGSGGGIPTVAILEREGLEPQRAHASAILAILPLSIISGIVYVLSGSLSFSSPEWWLLGGAAVGGLLGALLLGKLRSEWINGIFNILIITSGIRMLF